MVATRRSAKVAAEPAPAPAPAPAPQSTLKAPPKRAPRKKAVAQETATKPAPAPKVKKTVVAPKRKAEEEPEAPAPAPKRVTRSKATVVEPPRPIGGIKKPAPRARKVVVPEAAPKPAPAPAATSKKPARARAPAPMTTKAALAELPAYPTTPAHIKAPMSNKDGLATLAGYPSTPAHIVAPMGTKTALAELAGYPETPAHITAPMSNKTGLAALPRYPTTPAHITAPVPNKEYLAELAGYPTTPAHIQPPVLPSVVDEDVLMEDVDESTSLAKPSFMSGVDDNSLFIDKEDLGLSPGTPARINAPSVSRTPLAELPLEDMNTPAPVVVSTPTTIGLGELGPDCSGTPLYAATPAVARETSSELSEAPHTPITNQKALRELPSYPVTPAVALEAAIQEEITASVKKQTPSPVRSAHSPEVSFASTEPSDFIDGASWEVDTQIYTAELVKQTPSPNKQAASSAKSPEESFASTPGTVVRKSVRLSDIDFLKGSRPKFEPYNPDVDDFAPSETPTGLSSSELREAIPEQPTSKLQFAPIQLSAPLPAPEPSSPMKSALRSPQKLNAKTPKKAVTFHEEDADQSNMFLCEGSPLRGVTIFVDVTSNGKQNNFVFTSYLEDLGATIANECTAGITHVLFKDGSINTLEKVIESKGAIKCVNTGWPMKCEEEKKRVDESDYLVDLTPAMPKSPSPIKMNPFTPARTPSKYALPPSSQCGSLPTTPTSSEIDRSITIDEDKENDVSLTELFCGTNAPRTCPTKKTSVLFGKSATRTPSRARNLFGVSRPPLSEGKKRSFDSSSLGLSMSVPPKKPRLFA